MSESTNYHEYDMLSALAWLRDIERKNGGLLNGNFSMAAYKHRLKVKDLRERWDETHSKRDHSGLSTVERIKLKKQQETSHTAK